MGFKSLSSDGFYGWTNVIVASIFMFTITIMLQTFSLFLPEWINEYGHDESDSKLFRDIPLLKNLGDYYARRHLDRKCRRSYLWTNKRYRRGLFSVLEDRGNPYDSRIDLFNICKTAETHVFER